MTDDQQGDADGDTPIDIEEKHESHTAEDEAKNAGRRRHKRTVSGLPCRRATTRAFLISSSARPTACSGVMPIQATGSPNFKTTLSPCSPIAKFKAPSSWRVSLPLGKVPVGPSLSVMRPPGARGPRGASRGGCARSLDPGGARR